MRAATYQCFKVGGCEQVTPVSPAGNDAHSMSFIRSLPCVQVEDWLQQPEGTVVMRLGQTHDLHWAPRPLRRLARTGVESATCHNSESCQDGRMAYRSEP